MIVFIELLEKLEVAFLLPTTEPKESTPRASSPLFPEPLFSEPPEFLDPHSSATFNMSGVLVPCLIPDRHPARPQQLDTRRNSKITGFQVSRIYKFDYEVPSTLLEISDCVILMAF